MEIADRREKYSQSDAVVFLLSAERISQPASLIAIYRFVAEADVTTLGHGHKAIHDFTKKDIYIHIYIWFICFQHAFLQRDPTESYTLGL